MRKREREREAGKLKFCRVGWRKKGSIDGTVVAVWRQDSLILWGFRSFFFSLNKLHVMKGNLLKLLTQNSTDFTVNFT